ncbi:MAG: DUF4291 domain-containing protein [Acidobacteria bacterium]|nr:DUF4291 domain-containing protein [Acidobacteriota bacterium]
MEINLKTIAYDEQQPCWPAGGRHILAQFDDDSIVVYQAFRPAIGRFAAEKGFFGGPFSYDRMSWIKPNFLWMMYRSGWGAKEGQEVVLAVRLKRDFFDRILAAAVPSSFDENLFPERAEWSAAVAASDVRRQWDPDHDPTGAPLRRRAVQLGLRGAALAEYGRAALVEIEDISAFVAEQRANVGSPALFVPEERIYRSAADATAARLGLSPLK